MRREDSIYIVKGKTNSALINLGTYEMRAISNAQLEGLGDDVELEADLSDYIVPEISAYQKQILDIRLSKSCESKQDFSFLNAFVQDGAAYLNVRIICPEKADLSIQCVRRVIDWVNKNIYHFGIVILITTDYDKELFSDYFSSYSVGLRPTELLEEKLHTPILRSSPNSIFISQKNNLYHYSRDTVEINEEEVVFTDHDQFNIPKAKIENCKDCEYRLTCYDTRRVEEIDGKYYYKSTCKNELD